MCRLISKPALKLSDSGPIELDLNDDTLLDKVAFDDETASQTIDDLTSVLSAIDQSILLAFCLNIANNNPDDGLTAEQMIPFVSRVLSSHQNWSIATMALILKSRLEGRKSRTVERSCLQMSELINQFKSPKSTDADATERLSTFFMLQLPPKWYL